MTSRWPSVVNSPTRAPLCSSRALVATVVPWTIRSVSASSAESCMPSTSASSFSPPMTPSEGSFGAEGTLAKLVLPESSTATRSVNVPPTSTPMRYIWSAPADSLPRERGRGHLLPSGHFGYEPVLNVVGGRGGIALGGVAPATAAAGFQHEHIVGVDHQTDFLGADWARRLAVGIKHVAVRQAV